MNLSLPTLPLRKMIVVTSALATSTAKMKTVERETESHTGGAVSWNERTFATWQQERRTGDAGVTHKVVREERERSKKRGAAVRWKSRRS